MSESSASVPALDWASLLLACREGRLVDRLRERPLPVPELLDAAPLPREGEPYGRQCLFRDDAGEVLLVGWREARFSAPHDHGSASGFIQFLRGSFVERSFELCRGELTERSRRVRHAPALLRVEPGRIHDMRAEGGGVSMHFYWPPITDMTVFDRERCQALVVRDDCGAWIPSDPRLVRSRRNLAREP